MRRIKLSRLAEMDLNEIELQTIEFFGFDQAVKLAETFQNTFGLLCDTPLMGRERPDLSPPSTRIRSWTVMNRFLILYQANEQSLDIIRVVYAFRELRAVLDEDIGQIEKRNDY